MMKRRRNAAFWACLACGVVSLMSCAKGGGGDGDSSVTSEETPPEEVEPLDTETETPEPEETPVEEKVDWITSLAAISDAENWLITDTEDQPLDLSLLLKAADGLNNYYCVSFEWLSEFSFIESVAFHIELPTKDEEAAGTLEPAVGDSYLYVCSTVLGVYKVHATSELSGETVVLFKFEKTGEAEPEEEAHNILDDDLATGAIGSSVGEVVVISLANYSYEEDVYLGCWTCSEYSPESIHNDLSGYGSPYSSTSIRNSLSSYGSKYDSNSACNKYASNPPALLSEDGQTFYGFLTVASFGTRSICNTVGAFYHTESCDLLKAYCAS